MKTDIYQILENMEKMGEKLKNAKKIQYEELIETISNRITKYFIHNVDKNNIDLLSKAYINAGGNFIDAIKVAFDNHNHPAIINILKYAERESISLDLENSEMYIKTCENAHKEVNSSRFKNLLNVINKFIENQKNFNKDGEKE